MFFALCCNGYNLHVDYKYLFSFQFKMYANISVETEGTVTIHI